MEQLLVPEKSSILLKAPLETLHQESKEWLDEIEFCRDEFTFFFTLMLKNIAIKPKTKTVFDIEHQLIYLSSEKLDGLLEEIQMHKRLLSEMLKTVRWLDEDVYCSKHRNLSKKFCQFEMERKLLKKQIFQLIANSNY